MGLRSKNKTNKLKKQRGKQSKQNKKQNLKRNMKTNKKQKRIRKTKKRRNKVRGGAAAEDAEDAAAGVDDYGPSLVESGRAKSVAGTWREMEKALLEHPRLKELLYQGVSEGNPTVHIVDKDGNFMKTINIPEKLKYIIREEGAELMPQWINYLQRNEVGTVDQIVSNYAVAMQRFGAMTEANAFAISNKLEKDVNDIIMRRLGDAAEEAIGDFQTAIQYLKTNLNINLENLKNIIFGSNIEEFKVSGNEFAMFTAGLAMVLSGDSVSIPLGFMVMSGANHNGKILAALNGENVPQDVKFNNLKNIIIDILQKGEEVIESQVVLGFHKVKRNSKFKNVSDMARYIKTHFSDFLAFILTSNPQERPSSIDHSQINHLLRVQAKQVYTHLKKSASTGTDGTMKWRPAPYTAP